jgi:imidazole glycerol phosphate synthase glutamine amidotransferase subunit
MNIALLDYGAGNVPSVERALDRLGAASQRVNTPDCLDRATAIILPGVGHYAALIRALDEKNLRNSLLTAIRRGVPFLGICLGLQALYESSEEAPEFRGLHLFGGPVRALPSTVKLPHMGWNQVQRKTSSRLLDGTDPGAYFYFAHSFAASAAGSETVAACTHGAEFAAVLEKKKIFAVQFHPEKSGAPGARILENFLRLVV